MGTEKVFSGPYWFRAGQFETECAEWDAAHPGWHEPYSRELLLSCRLIVLLSPNWVSYITDAQL